MLNTVDSGIENLQAVNPPFPGALLRLGSRGSNVLLMQQYLNSIRTRFYPSLPLLTQDGIFGPRTQQAVIAYQALEGLRQDGIIGPLTWNSIVLKYQSGGGGGVNPPFPGTLLRLGSRGSDVLLMQQYLNSIRTRFYPSLPLLTEDGIFGPRTQQAVIAFQGLESLRQDGIIGPLTWNAIVLKYQSGGGGVNPPFPGTPLRLGNRGSDVLLMQQYLNSIRIRFFPQMPLLAEDGFYGPRTREAVLLYQSLSQLTTDGIIGEATWNSIVLKYQSGDVVVDPPFPGTVLEIGSTGSDVARMQEYLNAIRENFYPMLNELEVDGIFGGGTQTTVRQYQTIVGLPVDGKIGEQTWNSIVLKYNSIDGGGERVWPGYNLTYGATGPDVTFMQQRLNVIHTVYAAADRLTVDGNFEQATANATRLFQKQFGLTADGVIGENTWNRIVTVSNGVTNSNYVQVVTPYGGTVLENGSSGDGVRFVQSYLNRINTFNSRGWAMLTVDGQFGSGTQSVVMQFQAWRLLPIDGKVGPNTWTALRQSFNGTLV